MLSMIGCSVELPGALCIGRAEEGFEPGEAEKTQRFGVAQVEHAGGPRRAAVLLAYLHAAQVELQWKGVGRCGHTVERQRF